MLIGKKNYEGLVIYFTRYDREKSIKMLFEEIYKITGLALHFYNL